MNMKLDKHRKKCHIQKLYQRMQNLGVQGRRDSKIIYIWKQLSEDKEYITVS